MAYGSVLTDTVQSSTAATAPVFKDGNGTQIGTLCRAWVNFNGTGTVAIRASFNVSSITDNGTGDYTVNFTNALPDANYSPQLTGYWESSGAEGAYPLQSYATAPTTTAFRFVNGVPGTNGSTALTLRDSAYLNVSIFR